MTNRFPLKEFRYYFATDLGEYNKYERYFSGEDILLSYAYLASPKAASFIDRVRKRKGRVMIDSGGFTNFTKPGSVKFESWCDFMLEHKSWVDEYVQLDDLRSRSKTIQLFEAAVKAGLDPLFVDHLWFNRRPPFVDKMWKKKDKLCLSGFAKTKPGQERFPGDPKARFADAMKRADDDDTVTHLLAVGSLRRFLPYLHRIHSVDSAAWDKASAYGGFLAMRWDKLGDVRVPVLAGYSHPGASTQSKPPPPEVKAKVWDAVVRANGWTGESWGYKAQLVSLHHVKRYVRAIQLLDPVALRERLKVGGPRVRKMLEDGTADAHIWPDDDPRDPCTPEPCWMATPQDVELARMEHEAVALRMATLKIRDVRAYDPSKLHDDVLRDDFRIVLAWWAQRQKNPSFKHSPATLERLLRAILREAVRRGQDVIRFDPKGMEPSVRGFFLRVAREVGVPERMFKDEGAPPQQLASLEPGELTKLHDDLHRRFRREAAEARTVEPLVNLHARVVNELARNDKRHPPPPDDGLDAASRDFESAPTAKRYMTVHRSGEERGREITLAEVVERLDSFKVRKPFISIVGGLANHGSTKGDIDVLVNDDGSLPESFMHVLHFRLGRGLGDLADRLSIHTNKFNGPFTNFVELYDLTVERTNRQTNIKEMCVVANGDESAPKDGPMTTDGLELDEEHTEKRALALLSFTPMPKPTRPALPGKRQTVDSFIELHSEREDWLPTLVQKKYDGVRAQIHRDGERVVVFTEQGEDITARLPALVDELKSLKPRSFVLDSELERWVGKQHLPREATSGYLSSKDEPDDAAAGIVANIFDVLSLDGRDTHELPVERRVELLDKLGIAQSTMEAPDGKHRLNRAPSKRVETPAQLRAATERIRRLPGSEGVVVKRVGSPYPLAKVTLDTWVKFHNATVLQGTVLGRERVQSGVWTYQWGVLPGKEKPKALDKSGKVVPVGDSFNTTRDAKAGDTIPIEAESVNLTRTPDGVELTAWVPRVLDEEPGKPDTVDTATARARHDLVLQEKEVDAKGHVTYVPTRKSVAKQQDVYLIAPSEDGRYRYVVQHHYRGRGVHSDLRIELKPKRLLIGWTLNTMIEGTIKEPVLALSDAREHARRMAEVSKIDWNTGEWARRPKRGTPKLVRTTIAAERKAPEPFAWLNVEGATKKPEPGKPPPVGATRNFPGVFLIVDSGTAEYGAQKPWAHEYFFHGDALNYRVMFRMLRLGAKKRAGLPELCVMCKREPAVREVAWADEPESAGLVCDGCVAAWASRRGVLLKTILPPSKPPPAAPRGESWFAIRPDDLTPNVLSRAEVKKGWMPPHGKSALPRAVREQVPKELRYWDAPPAKARGLRDALVEAIAKHEVKVDFEAPYRRPAKKLSQLDARFVLQEQTWHGPVQIRVGPSSTVWWLRVDTGAGKVLSLKLLASPLDNERVAALVSREPRSTMSVSGQVPPGTPLNPTKETPSVIATVDKGKASLLNVSDDWLKLKIAGERLKGLFGVKRNKPGDEWLWAPAEPAPVVEKVSVGEADGYALTVPIIKADEERGIITGIALEPEVRDAQGDIISAEVIEKAAYDFLARYGRADGTKLGIMHRKFGDIGWDLIESWIQRGSTSVNGQRVRDGSWMLSWRKTPDALGKAAWERVKRGELTGFSIGGFAVTR